MAQDAAREAPASPTVTRSPERIPVDRTRQAGDVPGARAAAAGQSGSLLVFTATGGPTVSAAAAGRLEAARRECGSKQDRGRKVGWDGERAQRGPAPGRCPRLERRWGRGAGGRGRLVMVGSIGEPGLFGGQRVDVLLVPLGVAVVGLLLRLRVCPEHAAW